jgi:hypothetical protein
LIVDRPPAAGATARPLTRYSVFLLSSVRTEFERTGDPRTALHRD